ncbi:hypothetical protein CEXT_191301 [Caerostris extrusa]|uniref:Uncharacterized protein n=1 Tax=Caerostris extrusa TaxID=172846 RepID=A0AAV4WNW7_CAEEX|nr:hypothetical protein CEXT_191301 [Caerostris extrusa]
MGILHQLGIERVQLFHNYSNKRTNRDTRNGAGIISTERDDKSLQIVPSAGDTIPEDIWWDAGEGNVAFISNLHAQSPNHQKRWEGERRFDVGAQPAGEEPTPQRGDSFRFCEGFHSFSRRGIVKSKLWK